MKNIQFYTLTLIFASVFLIVGCGGKTNSNAVDADLITNQKTADNPSAKNPEAKLTCAEPIWDFGRITEGEIVKHAFNFVNTGTEPLVISACNASCGCTTPTCDKKPVAPGESGFIEIRFDSKGKKNNQTKNVTITANTNPPETVLTISGFVIPTTE